MISLYVFAGAAAGWMLPEYIWVLGDKGRDKSVIQPVPIPMNIVSSFWVAVLVHYLVTH